ncbi:MAG: hypothetical protein AAF805_00640 [Planctomycetota bacterium]
MAASNRAARLTKLVAALKKRFKPVEPTPRPVFETVLFAALLENSPVDAAEKAMAELESNYFDWNEVRVSSRAELAERLKPLCDPAEAADRLKRSLQSIFESIYAFDMEVFKKQNLGQSVKQLAGYDGVTPFMVAFAAQRGLAGHSIAVNGGVLLAMEVMEIITPAEAKKGQVPGLERAIPKNKGAEAHGLLHEMGVEIGRNPYGTAAKKLLTDLDPSCKDRLPKRPPKPAPAEAKPAKKPAAKADAPKPEPAKAAPTKKDAAVKAPAKKAAAKESAAPPKKAPVKKAAAKKAPANKSPAKKTPAKKATAKTAKKPAAKKAAAPAKKKPAAKKAVKKAPAKKAAAKKKTAKAGPAKKGPAKRKPK